jgi:hypothetical protein
MTPDDVSLDVSVRLQRFSGYSDSNVNIALRSEKGENVVSLPDLRDPSNEGESQ